MTRTRRDLLRTAGVGALGLSAGCTTGLLSGSVEWDGGEPTYREWLPAPAALNCSDYRFAHVDAAAIREHRDSLHAETFDDLRSFVTARERVHGLNLAQVVSLVRLFTLNWTHLGTVMIGRFAADDVADALTGAGFAQAGNYGEYRRYEHDAGVAAAVTDGVLFWSGRVADRIDAVSAVVGARHGERTRYHEVSDDIATLTKELGAPAVAMGYGTSRIPETDAEDGDFAGAVGRGKGWDVGEETTRLNFAVPFASATEAAPGRVEEWARGQPEFRDYDRLDVREDGRVVSLRGRIATGRMDLLSPNDPDETPTPSVPQVSLDFDHDQQLEVVEIVHAAGDPLDTAELAVLIDGEPTATQFDDEYEEVTAGAAITVDVSAAPSGVTIAVVWEGGDRSSVLGRYELV